MAIAASGDGKHRRGGTFAPLQGAVKNGRLDPAVRTAAERRRLFPGGHGIR